MSNSKEAYNNVEFSNEELSSLESSQTTVSESPKEETQSFVQGQPEAVSEQAEGVTNPEGSNGNVVYELEMGGQTYTHLTTSQIGKKMPIIRVSGVNPTQKKHNKLPEWESS